MSPDLVVVAKLPLATLSGGNRQRVAIAQALPGDPRIRPGQPRAVPRARTSGARAVRCLLHRRGHDGRGAIRRELSPRRAMTRTFDGYASSGSSSSANNARRSMASVGNARDVSTSVAVRWVTLPFASCVWTVRRSGSAMMMSLTPHHA